MLRIRRPYDPSHLDREDATPTLVSSRASSFPSRRTQGVGQGEGFTEEHPGPVLRGERERE